MDLSRRALLAAIPASAAAAGSARAAAGNGEDAEENAEWEPLGRLSVTGAAEAAVSGDRAYVATVDGFAVVDLADPASPELIAERRGLRVDDGDLREGVPDGNDDAEGGDDGASEALTEVLDLAVEGDRLVVPGPANPGQGVFHGFALYDVGEPADPRPLGTYETGFHIHNAELREGYCYLVGNDGERNPLVIVDVSGEQPREVGRWSLLEHDSRWAEVDSLLWYLHDVTLSGDLAVLAYWNAGTYLVDVSDPANPEYVGHVAETDVEEQLEVPPTGVTGAQQTLPGNDHYARLAGDLLAVGREAWAGEEGDPEGSGGIDLYDASDPADVDHLATIEAPPTEDASYSGGEWTTSHNFTVRDGRLYASWYRGGVSIHDVSDPAEPTEVARWADHDRAAFWSAHAVDEIVVAPSTPLVPNAPTEGAVYTFPASLASSPSSEEASNGSGEDAGTEEGNESGAEGAEDEGRADGDEPATGTEDEGTDGGDGTDAAPEGRNESAAGNDVIDGDGLPGLEIGAAVVGGAAAGGVAVLAWLRLRGSDETS